MESMRSCLRLSSRATASQFALPGARPLLPGRSFARSRYTCGAIHGRLETPRECAWYQEDVQLIATTDRGLRVSSSTHQKQHD